MTRNKRRETILYLILLLLLIASGLILAQRGHWPRAPYHPQSKAAEGALVLQRWLEKMGYEVRPLPKTMASPPTDVDMIILFPHQIAVSDENAKMLHDWVAAGHTLILAAMSDEPAIKQQFGLDTRRHPNDLFHPRLFQDAPLFPQAPAALDIANLSDKSFDIRHTSAALPALSHHAQGKKHPAMIVQAVGKGVVWHVMAQAAPTNEALQGEMGYFIPAWLRTVPQRGVILLDIYHPLIVSQKPQPAAASESLPGYVLRTAWGRAALLASVLLLIFLLLQGRRLGPPLPAVQQSRRREAAEYVEAMARLKRRARQRHAIARHQRNRLRASLAERWHIDAALSTNDLITALQRSDDPPSPQQIQRIEAALSGLEAAPTEAELVRLAAEVDDILSER